MARKSAVYHSRKRTPCQNLNSSPLARSQSAGRLHARLRFPMNPPSSNSSYALGYSQAERDRLIRQAAQLAPLTERFFRDAGIGSGQRVLELGSGMGDVAMLVAHIVGPSGEVLGVERDANSIQFAESRVV